MPVLRSSAPKETVHMKVEKFMTHELVTLRSVSKMIDIIKALETEHAAWPVLNLADNMCGIIPKSVLIKLI